jgi:hypothetical protein
MVDRSFVRKLRTGAVESAIVRAGTPRRERVA